MATARYIVGIDLGTTHCAMACIAVDDAGEPDIEMFPVEQVTEPGNTQARPLLPSFLYLAGQHELAEGSLDLPWARDRDFAAGEVARALGAEVPGRVVGSAKSWLRHDGVDRSAPILPWNAADDVDKLSPLDVAQRYLEHLRDAWNAAHPEAPLLEQELYVTVPASFDAAARDLTARAAEAAGLGHATLLEEPQAAFYAWLAGAGNDWRERVQVDDRILVCDVGGGTTDLSLITVGEEDGELVLERVAVGDHILLGGDNMDLALAHQAAAKFAEAGHDLDAWQTQSLWHSCRDAKERLLADPDTESLPIVVVGRGSKLVGGTITVQLHRDEVLQTVVDGFFPHCALTDAPSTKPRAGMRELGLPYEADPAVTRHVARFLKRHPGEAGARAADRVLWNGGVMKAAPVRRRLLELLSEWNGGEAPVTELEGTDLDVAVARGAAYYGLARRGRGVRIRGGTARSYYVGIESAMPAVPGMPVPLRALCVVPFGMEEGDEHAIADSDFGLVVGQPVEFRFLGSTSRPDDAPGVLIERWGDEIEELSPLATTLPAGDSDAGSAGSTVPVTLKSRVTELGTLELWCVARDGRGQWKLEFNVREGEGAAV